MASPKEVFLWIARNSKRTGVTIAGFLLVVIGIVLLPLPGPGTLVIIAGLAVLSTEYVWARRMLDAAKAKAKAAAARARRRAKRTPEEP